MEGASAEVSFGVTVLQQHLRTVIQGEEPGDPSTARFEENPRSEVWKGGQFKLGFGVSFGIRRFGSTYWKLIGLIWLRCDWRIGRFSYNPFYIDMS